MPQEDLSKIRINNQLIGIIGLNHVMEEMAEECAEKSDNKVQAELLKRLSRKNYIPEHTKEDYGKAFLRGFNMFCGKPYEKEIPEGDPGQMEEEMEIKVLGPGCPRCQKTEQAVKDAVAEVGVDATVEKVTDVMEIAKYGVLGTPAVLVDGEIKSVGKIPLVEEINKWLQK